MYTLKREQFVPKPLSTVFAFFQRPENLARITPPWMRFVMLTPSPVEMAEGLRIDYAIRVLGIRVRWTSVITHHKPPQSFSDQQVRGPYASWEHHHTFVEKEGGTLVQDKVCYEMPYGFAGRVVHALYVRGALKRIFDFREKMTTLLLGD